MVPFELDLLLVVWVLKHRVSVSKHSHTSLMCSILPAMRRVNGGFWVEIFTPECVRSWCCCVTLVKSCFPIACEMEADFWLLV